MGSFLALGLSSAGPCYYDHFVAEGADTYMPLMVRLHAIGDLYKTVQEDFGLSALDNQTRLWGYFTDDFIGLGSGISAMPSMHVSFAMLFFLTIRQMNKWAGYAALGFLIITQIGSVHLGWHYAIDGYVSIIITYLLWRVAGYIIGLYEQRDQNIA